MPNGSQNSRQTVACVASGVVLGAVIRYLLSEAWPTPPAFPAPATFPSGGVAIACLTVGAAFLLAGFVFTAFRKSNARAFTVGLCAGVASLSQYAVVGASTVAAAGLISLVFAPVCGIAGLGIGVFSALAFRARTPAAEARAE